MIISISKFLQIIGVLFSVAGLLGEERLRQWDFALQNLLRKLVDFRSFFTREQFFYHGFFSELSDSIKLLTGDAIKAGFLSTWFLKISALLFWVFGLSLRMTNVFEVQVSNNLVESVLILFIIIIIVLYPVIKMYVVLIDDPQIKSASKQEKKSYIYNVIIGAGPPFGMIVGITFLIYCFYPLYLGVLVATSILEFILRMFLLSCLLPYKLLDSFAAKAKLRSAFLLLGLTIELIGIMMQ